MKLMIASDLHGSAYYVRELLKRYEEERPARLLLLGDILYHGPRNALPRDYDTKAVAAMLNALSPAPLCIRGNCDGEVDQMVLTFPVLPEYASVFAEGKTMYLTHGHHLKDVAPTVPAGDLILYGHTHVPAFREENGVTLVNPGSVSIPKEDSPHSYLLWEDGTFRWKTVETGEVWMEKTI